MVARPGVVVRRGVYSTRTDDPCLAIVRIFVGARAIGQQGGNAVGARPM